MHALFCTSDLLLNFIGLLMFYQDHNYREVP